VTDDDIERMRARVEQALDLKGEIQALTDALVEWERRQDMAVHMGQFGRGGPLHGLSAAALAEIKRIAQTDLQKQLSAAAKRLADL
jgi:hypothetical protein